MKQYTWLLPWRKRILDVQPENDIPGIRMRDAYARSNLLRSLKKHKGIVAGTPDKAQTGHVRPLLGCSALAALLALAPSASGQGTRSTFMFKTRPGPTIHISNVPNSTPGGVIGDKWRSMGGPRGILGPTTSDEKVTNNGRVHYVTFTNGEIAWSQNTGPNSCQVVYRQGSSVVLSWGPTDPFNYDKFIVRWKINGKDAGQQDVFGYRTRGRFEIKNASASSNYAFIVEGADDGNLGSGGHSIARQGWSAWVSVGPPAPASHDVAPPTLSVTASGRGASAKFHIVGGGFQPNSAVNVRVADDALQNFYIARRSDKDGKIDFTEAIPCVSGLPIHFSATDGRIDRNPTGNLWSNTVDLRCP